MKKRFDSKNEIRAIARERVGQPKARKVETPKTKREPKHKERIETAPWCEECDREMQRYGPAIDTGKMGYSCDGCGWSWDD